MNNYQLKYSKTQNYNTRYCVKDMVGSGSGSGGGGMIPTTYSELRALRDNGQLAKGAFYRITDYSTEVNESFSFFGNDFLCQSAHHDFDIIVLALSNDTLSEDAMAINHGGGSTNGNGDDNNGGGTDNGGDDNGGEKATTKSRNTVAGTKASNQDDTEDEEDEDYFAKSDLSAWELKYSLDVDMIRYPWAKPSGGGESKVVTLAMSAHPEDTVTATVLSENDDTFDGFPIKCSAMGTTVYLPSLQIADNVVGLIQMGFDEPQEMEFDILEVNTVANSGKGVITMMKDEFGNKLSYDFKNIKWARYLVTDNESPFYDMYYGLRGDGEPQYFYTFDGFYSEDVSCDTSLYFDVEEERSVMLNVFGEFCINNVFFGNYCYSNTFGNECYSNTFGNYCDSNTFGESNPYNKLEDFVRSLNQSTEVRTDIYVRRWFYDQNNDLTSEVLSYTPTPPTP